MRAGRPMRGGGSLRACLEIGWVAQATGLCRPATRRTEREGHPQLVMTACWSGQPLPFRSAGRRPGRASGPRHPFLKRAGNRRLAILNFQFPIAHSPTILRAVSDQKFDFDLAVIGGGSGGYAAARTAAGAGLKTVVLEGGKEVGGLCILRGCMPTKALLYAAEVRHVAQYGGLWGMKPGEVRFDWSAVMARKDGLIKQFADDRVQELSSGRFQFIRARARFTDPHTLSLSNGES